MVTCCRLVLVFFCLEVVCAAQGSPPPAPEPRLPSTCPQGTPPREPPPPVIGQVEEFVEQQMKKAVYKEAPSLTKWKPLSPQEKFQVFLNYSYSPITFGSAGISTLEDIMTSYNARYETGVAGLAQRYGVALSTSETDVFFQSFLMPALLRQDPRYFRNPSLPFKKRVVYSMSRVVITRSDSGKETFNSSRFIGGVISQAISDSYVPGQQQGVWPILNRFGFNLLRDSSTNLVREFWPDVRDKVLSHIPFPVPGVRPSRDR